MVSDKEQRPHRRTTGDLDRALGKLADYFGEDAFVVVGSQAVLVDWPSPPDEMRDTPEIDIYLARVEWLQKQNPDFFPDHEIAFAFGALETHFYRTHGFYIDGVSPETAPLPPDWKDRAVYREVPHGTMTLTAIAPCVEDLVVSKLRRLETKDKDFIEACNRTRGLDLHQVRNGLAAAPFSPEERERAIRYLNGLPFKKPMQYERVAPPPYPEDGTHRAFWRRQGLEVFIRELDPKSGLFVKINNPLGPAFKSSSAEAYYLDGKRIPKSSWEIARTAQEEKPVEEGRLSANPTSSAQPHLQPMEEVPDQSRGVLTAVFERIKEILLPLAQLLSVVRSPAISQISDPPISPRVADQIVESLVEIVVPALDQFRSTVKIGGPNVGMRLEPSRQVFRDLSNKMMELHPARGDELLQLALKSYLKTAPAFSNHERNIAPAVVRAELDRPIPQEIVYEWAATLVVDDPKAFTDDLKKTVAASSDKIRQELIEFEKSEVRLAEQLQQPKKDQQISDGGTRAAPKSTSGPKLR